MRGVIRNILAVIAGLLIGYMIIIAIQFLSQLVYPMPEGIDISDKAAMAEYVENMPFSAYLVVLVGYLLGGFSGGFTSAKIASNMQLTLASIVGFIFIISSIFNLMALPHPTWFVIVNILFFLIFPYLGGRFAIRQ